MESEDQLLELLELYMDLVEKQDVAIYHMSKVIAKQATEIQHYKNIHQFVDINEPVGLKEDIRDADEALKEYNAMKEI